MPGCSTTVGCQIAVREPRHHGLVPSSCVVLRPQVHRNFDGAHRTHVRAALTAVGRATVELEARPADADDVTVRERVVDARNTVAVDDDGGALICCHDPRASVVDENDCMVPADGVFLNAQYRVWASADGDYAARRERESVVVVEGLDLHCGRFSRRLHRRLEGKLPGKRRAGNDSARKRVPRRCGLRGRTQVAVRRAAPGLLVGTRRTNRFAKRLVLVEVRELAVAAAIRGLATLPALDRRRLVRRRCAERAGRPLPRRERAP